GRVHWGICTPIGGMPTDRTIELKPQTPVLAISRPDGDRVLGAMQSGLARVTIRTALEEGWYQCKVPVARIAGASDDFLLAHGHYDSWEVGVGDNAVGGAPHHLLARLPVRHRVRGSDVDGGGRRPLPPGHPGRHRGDAAPVASDPR